MKRGINGSPGEVPTKRARVVGNRPSELQALHLASKLMSAPEEHQRQAMEVAQRAAVQSAHANTNFVPQPVQVQRQLSQVSLHFPFRSGC